MKKEMLWFVGSIALIAVGWGVRTAMLNAQGQKNRALLMPTILAAEKQYGIPAGMLDRLLTRESHYRTDVIMGNTKSATGAIGVAQFMPATAADLGINPRNPVESITAAARYLKQINGWVGGDWKKTLAAYNWGIGNLRGAIRNYGDNWIAHIPPETKNYIAVIA